jgi:hypothetical protein
MVVILSEAPMVVILTLSATEREGSLYFVVAIAVAVAFAFAFVFCLRLCLHFTHHTQSRSLLSKKVAASFMVHLWCNVIQTFFLRRKQQNLRHSCSRTTSAWC